MSVLERRVLGRTGPAVSALGHEASTRIVDTVDIYVEAKRRLDAVGRHATLRTTAADAP